MDEEQIPPSQVGVTALPPKKIHRWDPAGYMGGYYYSECGRKMHTLTELRVDFLQPRPLCLRCFKRAGTISYSSSDRNAVIEYHVQEKMDV